MNKAAVVIGVNRTGELSPLASAAAGARGVAAWLKKEGFDVACLTDEKKPVTGAAVKQALGRFVVMPAQYHLLVVYFSGHGYWHAFADRWLLSGAPEASDEAVNLNAAMDLAQYSGIPNVVFISDACRTIPTTRAGALVQGVAAFPVFNSVRTPSKVDSFRATGEARAAYEGKVDGTAQSLLTLALRSAYESPDEGMVREVEVDGKRLKVVPNRRLEDYLQRKVDELLAGIDRRLRQDIVASVPSSEDVFIARVAKRRAPALAPAAAGARPPAMAPMPAPPAAGAAPGPVAEPRPPTAREDARRASAAVRSTLRERAFAPVGAAPPIMEDQGASVEGRLGRRTPDSARSHFESETGFVVQGAALAEAVLRPAAPGMAAGVAETLTPGDGAGEAALVRVRNGQGSLQLPPGWAGALGLRFADGRCALLPALPGYIAHVRVKPGGVAGVNYVPSANSRRWPGYAGRRDELDRLRAMVALATEQDSFQVRSEREAAALAERIRVGKAMDPTLGLYAALAFSRAGNDARVGEVLQCMREDLGADLFDVRLLASRWLPPGAPQGVPCVPPCPLLSQNWSLLGARGMAPPPPLQEAGAHLCNSLWTTFEPAGGDALMAWLLQGESP